MKTTFHARRQQKLASWGAARETASVSSGLLLLRCGTGDDLDFDTFGFIAAVAPMANVIFNHCHELRVVQISESAGFGIVKMNVIAGAHIEIHLAVRAVAMGI